MSWPWLAIALEAAWIVGVGIWILADRRAPTSTLAWIVVLAFLPVVGIPVYFFLGPRRMRRKREHYRGLAAHLSRALARVPSEREIPADVLRLVRLATRLDESPISTARRIELHHDGRAAFAAMERAIAGARHHLHLEFYIWEEDATGRRVRDLLVERARAGIEVRLLVDGMGARAGRRFFGPLLDAGGAWARFNPPLLPGLRFRFVNFRSHRKILVADGAVGFLGGMNVADEQVVGWRGRPAWRDTLLELEGRAVRGLQRAFFENWSFAAGEVLPADSRYFPQQRAGGQWLQIVRSGPDRSVYPIHELLFAAIAGADERVWATCPYLIPDEPVFTALRSAAHRGVDVRLLVPSEGDSRLVQAAVRSFYDDWLAAGIRVFEYRPTMLHAKSLVVDRELALVGSANLDNRSFRLNFEIVGALYGERAADALAETFLADLEQAREVGAADLARRGALVRLAQDTARLFSAQL